jgi:hypothetical protein
MNKLIFKTKSKPIIEMYEEYIVIREKKSSVSDIILKTYYKEMNKVIFVKEENVTWWMGFFISFLSILSGTYSSPDGGLYDKLMFYVQDNKGSEEKRFIITMTNKRKEIDNILKVLNAKLQKGSFKMIVNS